MENIHVNSMWGLQSFTTARKIMSPLFRAVVKNIHAEESRSLQSERSEQKILNLKIKKLIKFKKIKKIKSQI